MKLPTREQLNSIGWHQQRLHGTGVSLSAVVSPPATTSNTPPATPSKVPRTPYNTPVSTPAASATSSPATVVGSNTEQTKLSKDTKKSKDNKKANKMAKQNAKRAEGEKEKRHLVRWNAEMDAKLLLTVQYCCNFAGLGVPWNDIGNIMGEGITGGAVIQHLAKLRIRMIEQGLSVPPPLRRGGGGARVGAMAPRGSKPKATANKAGNTKANPAPTKSTRAKTKKGKKGTPGSDESDEDGDDWANDDSDAEYGAPPAKRAKQDAKGQMRRKPKTEDSDEEVATPSKPPKRKRQGIKLPPNELSAYGETDINGVPINYDDDGEDEADTGVVAAGAPFLALEDDDDYASHPTTDMKTPYKQKSLMVSLRNGTHTTGLVGGIKEEFDNMSNDESGNGVVGGGVESRVGGPHVSSNRQLTQFSDSPYSRTFEELAAAQMEPASGSTSRHGMYNNSYQTVSQVTPYNGSLYEDGQSSMNVFNSPGLFDDDDEFVDDQVMAQPGFFAGNNAPKLSNNFHDQSAGNLTNFNGGSGEGFDINGNFDTGSFGKSGLSDNFDKQNTFTLQTGNNYGGYSNNFGNNGGAFANTTGNGHGHQIPYPIQTSFSTGNGSLGGSSNTSVNQTPAGTSAGLDVGAGDFGNDGFDVGPFGDGNIKFSADDAFNAFFDDANFNGNFVSGDFFGSNPYAG